MTDPLRESSPVAVKERSDSAQTPPRAALPDVSIDVGAEPPEAAATARIPCADRPPVILEIANSHPEQSEPCQCPETPGKWFRLPARGTRNRGPALLLLHAILESVHLQPADGVRNVSPYINKET